MSRVPSSLSSILKIDYVLKIAIIIFAFLALALPFQILIFQPQTSADNISEFVVLHENRDFIVRVWLTFFYFPAAIFIHFMIAPKSGSLRSMFWLGFAFFLAGNAIDLVYRAVQYSVVHFTWAAEYIVATSCAIKTTYENKILTFAEIAPAVSLRFSILFAVGRLLMGFSLTLCAGAFSRIAGFALILNGIWNIFPRIASEIGLVIGPILGQYYLYPWLFSILAVSAYALINVAMPSYSKE